MAIFSRRKGKSKNSKHHGADYPPRPKDRKPLGEMISTKTLDFSPLSAFEMSSVVYTNSGLIQGDPTPNSLSRESDASMIQSFPASESIPCTTDVNSNESEVDKSSSQSSIEEDEREEKENLISDLAQISARSPPCEMKKKITNNSIISEISESASIAGSSAMSTSMVASQSPSIISRSSVISRRSAPESVYKMKSLMDNLSESSDKSIHDVLIDEDELDNTSTPRKSPRRRRSKTQESSLDSDEEWVRSSSPEIEKQKIDITKDCDKRRDKGRSPRQQKNKDSSITQPAGCVGSSVELIEDSVLRLTKECDKLAHSLIGGKHEWLWA